MSDGGRRQWADGHRYRPVAEIAVGIEARGWLAPDRGIVDVHRIGDHRRRRIRLGRASGERGDRIGDAEAEAAAAAPAGGNAAHGAVGWNLGVAIDGGCGKIADDPRAEAFALREMERDIATIVDIS